MPCLVVLVALAFPRIALALIYLFSDYLSRAFAGQSVVWPILGFIFMPFTTLAYAFAMNANHGAISGLYLVLLIIAVVVDLGTLGGGGHSYRRRRD